MCEFCKEPNGLFLTDGLFEQSRIECIENVTTKKKRFTLCVNNSAWREIKYCPICGRELK